MSTPLCPCGALERKTSLTTRYQKTPRMAWKRSSFCWNTYTEAFLQIRDNTFNRN